MITHEDLREMSADDLRTLAGELLHENRRLRLILDTLARAGVGVGAVAELATFKTPTSNHIGVVVCRADRDEREFLEDMRDALEALAQTFCHEAGVVDAIECEEPARQGSTREKGGRR